MTTLRTPAARGAAGGDPCWAVPGRARRAWLAASIVAAGLAIAASIIGEATDRIYRYETANWTAQTVAQDLVNLVVFPIMITLAVLALGGSLRAHLAWLGTLVFSVYSYAIYAFDIHFGPLFPTYVAVLGLSTYALAGGIAAIDLDDVRRRVDPRSSVRLPAWYLIVTGVVVYGLWLSQDLAHMLAGGQPQSLLDVGLPSNPVHVLDMAFLLPACIAAGALLRRRRPLGYVLGPVLLVALALLGITIVAIMIVSDVRGLDANWPIAAATAVSAGIALIGLAHALRAVGVTRS